MGREWREGKVRPIPGNSPHDRLVSRGILSPRRICDDPFPATPFPLLQSTILGRAQYAFFRHGGIFRSDVVSQTKTIQTWGGVPPPVGRPPAPVKGRDGRNYAPCSSSAMSSRAGYSLAGCSPAEPASASPTASSMGWGITAGNELSANGNLSLVSVSQPRGSLHPSGDTARLGNGDPVWLFPALFYRTRS